MTHFLFFLNITFLYILNYELNHHGSEISVIWLVEWTAIKLSILICYYGKTNFEVQINFNAKTTLTALFEIHFRFLFFDVEKRRQCSEVTAILWDLLWQFCSREMLLGCIAMVIRWWLACNRMVSVQLTINLTRGNLRS